MVGKVYGLASLPRQESPPSMYPWQLIWPVHSTLGQCQSMKDHSKTEITWNFYLSPWIPFCEALERKANSASREKYEKIYVLALLPQDCHVLAKTVLLPWIRQVTSVPQMLTWKNKRCSSRLSSIILPGDTYFVARGRRSGNSQEKQKLEDE